MQQVHPHLVHERLFDDLLPGLEPVAAPLEACYWSVKLALFDDLLIDHFDIKPDTVPILAQGVF